MIDLSTFKQITVDGIDVKELALGGTTIWKAVTYKNWVRYSTESDGVTIYNGGLGYKNGYRIRSGGAEASDGIGVCTGFMPFKKGDIMQIYPQFSGMNSRNTLNYYDINFNNLGQTNDSGSIYGICQTNSTQWKAIATESGDITIIDLSGVANAGDVAYVRLTHLLNGSSSTSVASGSELIVTINEEIT